MILNGNRSSRPVGSATGNILWDISGATSIDFLKVRQQQGFACARGVFVLIGTGLSLRSGGGIGSIRIEETHDARANCDNLRSQLD
jgi:hypothetical protein